MEEREWRFSLKFDLPEGVDIRNARLRFESVDTFATYELNGTVLGESKNVFLPVSFEVGALLREADPAVDEISDALRRMLAYLVDDS